MKTSGLKLIATTLVAVAALAAPTSAEAFCGFYVSGGTTDLYNNATQAVLMRDGTRTVLTMQNNYQGPLADFAMVIPVPIVLQEENVKTLDPAIFAKIDQLSAPRLVEYWEQDPCNPQEYYDAPSAQGGGARDDAEADNDGVVVEAEFKVGEYQIAILSASEATGLESWLIGNDYSIPDGAATHLDPYVEGGSYFFVAKIIAEEVRYEDGRAVLSPLRFHYDAETFSLPIRLGLISAEDQQDLIVYTLAQNQRYQVANYDNVTIPTNIDVREEARDQFGAFYNALFDRVLARNPGSVVTEYSWNAATCDPCPGPTLDGNDIATFGGDVIGGADQWGWVVTRLHARYDAGNVGDDLVFEAAPPIAGGREFLQEEGVLEEGSRPSEVNNFQARYAIRHAWDGPIECDEPNRGHWGGPPGDPYGNNVQDGATSPNTSGDDYRTQSAPIEELVTEEIPEAGIVPRTPGTGVTPYTGPTGPTTDSGCATTAGKSGLGFGLFALLAGLFVLRRKNSGI
jgi:MYXO-CTERM domain-containing protein